jgi:hypothetical protein
MRDNMLKRVPIESLCDGANKSFDVLRGQSCQFKRLFPRKQIRQELYDR